MPALEDPIIRDARVSDHYEMDNDLPPFARPARGEIFVSQAAVMQRLIEVTRERSAWWIIGTSLLGEVFILAVAAWMFCRRDF